MAATENENEKAYRGIAGLFETRELKRYVVNYIVLIGVVEIGIFLICFLSQLKPIGIPFPWRQYFFIAFAAPICITLLFGVITKSFNDFIFESEETPEMSGSRRLEFLDGKSRIYFIWKTIKKPPLMFSLMGLFLFALLLYHLDALIVFAGETSGTFIEYALWGAAGIICIAFIAGVCMVILKYRLYKKNIDLRYQFRKDILDQTGLILLDNDTVMTEEGQVMDIRNVKGLPVTMVKNRKNEKWNRNLPR